MANDSKNKLPNVPDNVVSLSRHEFVASIEEKLAEARRLFGLHDHRAAEELVLEVLALDPHSSKAKALLDLTSIKLSKRRLYKKIVDSEAASSSASVSPSIEIPIDDAAHLDPASRLSPEFQTRRPSAPPPATERRKASRSEEPQGKRRPQAPAANPAVPVDSIRERTISALVDLLRQKEKSLENWRDPRFSLSEEMKLEADPEPQQDAKPSTTVSEAPSPAKNLPSVAASSSAKTKPVLPDKSDFFPGSLSDLFESSPPRPSPAPVVEAKTVVVSRATPLPELKRPIEVVKPVKKEKLTKKPGERPVLTQPVEPAPRAVRPPDVQIFDQFKRPRKTGYDQIVEQKFEQRSEEIKNSELKTVSIAQIKKYLYQEQYELCAQELEQIRSLFPQSVEIQAFVANTSKRLADLQRVKAFEQQAKQLMGTAVTFYQEGKLEEALIAAGEVLRVIPNHVQAKEFVSFVERRHNKEKKKGVSVENVRYCRACGTTVDAVSQFCHHCGKRLT